MNTSLSYSSIQTVKCHRAQLQRSITYTTKQMQLYKYKYPPTSTLPSSGEILSPPTNYILQRYHQKNCRTVDQSTLVEQINAYSPGYTLMTNCREPIIVSSHQSRMGLVSVAASPLLRLECKQHQMQTPTLALSKATSRMDTMKYVESKSQPPSRELENWMTPLPSAMH